MPNFLKLIYMEHMILLLLHSARKWHLLLEWMLKTLKRLHRPRNANHSARLTHVQALANLLYGHILTLFIIGSQVTDYLWAGAMVNKL